MGPELIAYPFLILALFIESFILVTFLSKPARTSRKMAPATGNSDLLPTVAIIVPCWNEGETVAATADSLLALDYPKDRLEIILVDNSSTDDTPQVMERYRGNPQIRILREEKRGKHYAVNAGIALTNAELIGCLDADSFVEPGSLREMTPHFADPHIGATTAAMSVYRPQNLLQHMQNAEYIFGIIRQNALSVVGGIHVTPGPFSIYRRSAVVALGGFKHGHQTEDLEMALRLQKGGYQIANAQRARVYTKAPTNVLALVKQRTRWTSGFMRNVFNEYRDMIGSSQYGALGLITLPVGILTIGSSILLFGLALFEFARHLITAIEIRVGVPLSYSLLPHRGIDWFYFPASLYTLLAAITVIGAITMIAIGKKISNTPGSLGLGIFSYVLLYGLIAPLWLVRASVDVALGKRRLWR